MKRMNLLIALALICVNSGGQTINTAVPFLEVPTTAAGLAMGNTGVAMGENDNSTFYNSAKMAFQKPIDIFSASYVPWMWNYSNDMKLVNVNYSYKYDEVQTFAGGLTYFNMGRLLIKNEEGAELGNIRSNELAVTGTYARALRYDFSVAVTLRGIYSRILNTENFSGVPDIKGKYGIAADLSLYRTFELDYYKNLHLGLNLSNIGTKMSYSSSANKTSIPTSIKLGISYDNEVNDDNSFSVGLDINKLLVPSPPQYDAAGLLIKGKDPNRSYLSGLFTSLYDAPGGVREELKEINVCTGGEYRYKNVLALRAGISYESKLKGNRSYIGAGVEYKGVLYDQKYAIGVFYVVPYGNSIIESPLKKTFGLSINFRLGEED